MSTPTEISELETLNVSQDLQKGLKKVADSDDLFMAVGRIKNGRNSLRALISGEVSTEGINCSDFSDRKYFSFGIELTGEEDVSCIEHLDKQVEEALTANNLTGYEVLSLVKDDKIYIKLPAKKNKFTTRSNIKMEPKKYEDSGIFRGQEVSIIGDAT